MELNEMQQLRSEIQNQENVMKRQEMMFEDFRRIKDEDD